MVAQNSTLCPSDNAQIIDQSSFWSSDGVNWDAHRIGWVVSGACAAVTVLLTAINVSFHCSIRILYMPAVYALISFFSYRFFRSYTYYDLIECGTAFLLLLIEYVAATAVGHDVDNAILRKDKSSLPIPFCCWRYRPTKLSLSIAGIICQHYGVLCESGPWSFKTAHAYISVIDAVSITVALYGLLIFYGLTKDELVGKKPLAKFLSIKLIVMFTFYQYLVFDALEGVKNSPIKATSYWTPTNIVDGLNALAICIEMVLFSAFMMHAYTWKEYIIPGRPKTGFGRPLLDSINYADFAREIWSSTKFFIDYMRGKPGTHGVRVTVTDADGRAVAKKTYGEAFGFEHSSSSGVSSLSSSPSANGYRGRAGGGGESMSMSAVRPPRESYEENIRLAPYQYGGGEANSPEGYGTGPSMENVSIPRY
ncbi:organic solute transporter Ostalpha-domain-containing protein [Dichomitus squalens]|uniref:Organic solute transporter Ostalpha-domain-containing protein n=1 Tax=Dichomitus squalens TaxID=114155 RepID=A0A4Q9MFH5_9APHY|nr:organic solute transporter Ostalpha-domain-containing protein [Dichomitus squalens]